MKTARSGATDSGAASHTGVTRASRWVSDVSLVQSTLAGDPEATRQFTLRMTVVPRYLRSRAARIGSLLPPGAMDDVAQETVLRAWHRRASFDGSASLETWTVGIVRHVLLEWIRRFGNELGRPDVADEPLDLDRLESPGRSVADVVSDRLLAELAGEAMARLDELDRFVLEQRIHGERSFEEIAAARRMSVAKIKSRYYRALGGLSERMPDGELAD